MCCRSAPHSRSQAEGRPGAPPLGIGRRLRDSGAEGPQGLCLSTAPKPELENSNLLAAKPCVRAPQHGSSRRVRRRGDVQPPHGVGRPLISCPARSNSGSAKYIESHMYDGSPFGRHAKLSGRRVSLWTCQARQLVAATGGPVPKCAWAVQGFS